MTIWDEDDNIVLQAKTEKQKSLGTQMKLLKYSQYSGRRLKAKDRALQRQLQHNILNSKHSERAIQ